jgi:O-antigen/teichoic acid export membrane protein
MPVSSRLTNLRSLQLMQLLRYGTVLLGSILIAQNIPDKHLVGEFEFWVLLGSSTTFFWVSGIINTFIPYFHRQGEEYRRILVFNVFLLLSGLSLIVGIFIWVGSNVFAVSLPSVGWYYLAYALLTAPAFLIEYLLLVHNKPHSIAWYAVFSSALYVAAFAVPFFLVRTGMANTYSLNFAAQLLFALGAVRYVFLFYLVGIFGKVKASFEILKPFLRQSWPVIVGLLFGGSMMYVDAYIVRIFFTPDRFAVFQYGARELPLALLLANAISNVVSGELAMQGDNNIEGLATLKSRSRRLMHLLFPLSIVLLIFSEPLYQFVFTKSFGPSSVIFDIYLLLVISRVIFPQTVLLSMGKTRTLLRATLLEWTVNLVLNLGFIVILISAGLLDDYGLQAIAMVTVLAYLFEKLYLAHKLKQQGIWVKTYTPVKEWMFYSILIVLVFVVKMVFLR